MGTQARQIDYAISRDAEYGFNDWFLPEINPGVKTGSKKPTRNRKPQNIETITLDAKPILQNSSGQIERVFNERDSRRMREIVEERSTRQTNSPQAHMV